MSLKKFRKIVFASLLVTSTLANAQNYQARDIRIEGLEHLEPGVVFSAINVDLGAGVQKGNTQKLIRDLYATGLFKNVSVRQAGGVLVVSVVEQPAIASVTLTGNKDINDKQFKELLRSASIYEGQFYNDATIVTAKNSLLKAYEAKGKYAVTVNVNRKELPRNRVAVEFVVSEGRSSRVKKIRFSGNKAYSDHRLASQMSVRESGLKTLLSTKDRYDQFKIGEDLDAIEKFYKNRGYMNAEINHSAASITHDKEFVYLDIDVNEGKLYTITDFDVVGNTDIPKEELLSLILIKKGKPYKMIRVEDSVKAIKDRLGDDGYALASVNAIPIVNEEDNTVSMNFAVDSGERSYVRRINIEGNERTQDNVLRREMRQMEGGIFVTRDVERSKIRIQRLPYIQEADVDIVQVDNDLVDLTYRVKERNAGSITFGISYGMDTKIGFNAGFSQPNFMGTGHELSVQAETDDSGHYYSIDYTDPYFTKNGLSAGVSLRYSKEKHDYDDTGNFIADGYSAMFNFGYPLSEYTGITASIGYERLNLSTTIESPIEIVEMLGGSCETHPMSAAYCSEFTPRYKARRNLIRSSLAIFRDTRNRTLFASEGSLNSLTLSGTLPGSDDKFYKLHYKHQSYYPLMDDDNVVFNVRGDVISGHGYGSTSGLPFYENMYAGGLRTVRGFRTSSLGPKYLNGDSAGGAFRVNATAEVIMRVPGFVDNNDVRWSLFVDGGQVFRKAGDFKVGDLRYSAGISFAWVTPLGPLMFSYAQPLNSKKSTYNEFGEMTRRGDREQAFQFSIGIPF